MSETAIRVTNVTKEYTIDYSHTGSFKELVMRKLFHGHQYRIESRKNILALDNLSFEVKKGEALGIIGKNGAGKSTLLKVLSGITKPTTGEIEIYGRMSSILDIGVGFHPELTGRENIYLSGELNGLGRKEIKRRMDEIIDFSGVEKFIDTPVKYYSSGMLLRLAFSVFTGIDSDVLLLDEVMSVGDAEFQLKSSKKLQSMFGQGKTIMLVSHNPADIVNLCSRVIILDDGKIKEEGMPGKVVVDYMEESIIEAMDISEKEKEIEEAKSEEITESKPPEQPKLRSAVQWDDMATAPGNEYFKIYKVSVYAYGKDSSESILISDKIVVEIIFEKLEDSDSFDLGFLVSYMNNFVYSSTIFYGKTPFTLSKNVYKINAIIPSFTFNSGIFSIDIIAHATTYFYHNTNLFFKIENIPIFTKLFPTFPGPFIAKLRWKIEYR